MNNIYYDNENSSMARIEELKYGTIITGLRGYPKCIYMKVNKRDTGEGLNLMHSKTYSKSVLMNLKLGTLRAIAGSEPVIVLDAEIKLKETKHVSENIKDELRKDSSEDEC